MAITTGEKLRELRIDNKMDDSISTEYSKCLSERDGLKAIYKNSKDEYKAAKERLGVAEEKLKNIPLSKVAAVLKANKDIKQAKRELKDKKKQLDSDRSDYYSKLRELRNLRREIRSQYKSNKEYKKFFDRVKKAQNMGINLPRYIMDEYRNQQSIYAQQLYSINKTGARTYIAVPNTDCSKDVQSLINEKIRKDAADKLTQMKDKFLNRSHSQDKDDR